MKKLLWIYYGSLSDTLDKATWMETSAELSKIGWKVTLLSEGIPDNLDPGVSKIIFKTPKMFGVRYIYFHLLLLWNLIKGEFQSVDVWFFV